jgi:flagellar capping protein FliD
MATSAVGGTALERLQNYKEPTIKRVTKAQQTKIDAVTLKHEGAVEQSTALGTLSGLVRSFTGAAAVLQRPYDSPFDKKSATLTTTDVGIAQKYISVTSGKYTPKMAFDVHVNTIATASKIIISDGGASHIKSGANTFYGNLTINVDGVANVVQITPGDTLANILTKINSQFVNNGARATATSLKIDDVNGYYDIIISSQELGNKVLTFNWAAVGLPNANNSLLGGINAGTQADITIDGVQIAAQDSNVFENVIPGITIKALAPNTVGPVNKQTVTIAPDTTNDGVVKDIAKFVRAYNDLKIFVAKMTEKISDKEYAPTAVLNNFSAIRQARFLLDSVFDPSINSGGKYKLLSDVGIGLAPAEKDEEAPIGTTLLSTVDEEALRNALETNYEDFTALFVGKLKVTANAVRGSKLDLSMMTEPLESKFYNTPMRVKINPGAAAGQVAPFTPVQAVDDLGNLIFDPDPAGGPAIPRMISWDVEVEIDGITNLANPLVHTPIRGHYTRNGTDTFGYIDFKDTDLKGLRLQWDAVNVVVGAPEVFTVNLSQGLSDLAYFRSNDLMSEDGNRGTLILTSKEIQQKVKDLSAEQTKLETILEKELDKIEQQFAKIEQMSILNDIFLDAISDLLNPTN